MQPSLHPLLVPALLAALRRLGEAVTCFAATVRRRRQAAATRRALSTVPHHLLADLGLQRSEAHSRADDTVDRIRRC